MKLRFALAIPLLVYLLLCGLLLIRGRAGEWHVRCVQFWQQQDWTSLCSLATNLDRLGTPDPEAEYFAAMAGLQLNDRDIAAQFAMQWLSRRALNWRWESDLAPLAPSRNLVDRARFYRVRIAALLLLLVVPLNLLSIRKLLWNAAGSAFAMIGIALLLL